MSAQVVHKKTGKNTAGGKTTAGGKKVVNTKNSKKAKKSHKGFKRFVDVILVILLLCLTARQVSGESLHEWIGIAMAALLLLHHLLNIRWTGSFFKGRYTLYRIILTVVNLALLAAIVLTVLTGISMSNYALPSLYGLTERAFAQQFHLSMSWWAFALMGAHLGLHTASITSRLSNSYIVRRIVNYALALAAGTGLWLLIKNGIPDYLFFRTHFASFDYSKPALIVFAENLAELFFFVWIGIRVARLLLFNRTKKKK